MTLLLACASPEGLILACDNLLVHDWLADEIDNKWIKHGPWYIGVSGVQTIAQAIRFGNGEPAPADIASLIAWFRRVFVVHGVKPNEHGEYSGFILIARQKDIWRVDSALAANKIKTGAWACAGAAHEIAIGALDAFDECGQGIAPSDVARLVMGIAERRCAAVRGCRVEVIPYGPETNVTALRHPELRQMSVPEH